MNLIAYIDGFNLYHAIADLQRPHLKWVNLWSLCESLALKGEKIIEVNYFSAYATWMPGPHQRHIEYVKALEYFGVKCLMGHFKNKSVNCNSCGNGWVHHEEKETDVHIAARIVADAYQDRFDRAILITADSDLAPALKIVKAAFPKKGTLVVAPPKRFGHARDLKPAPKVDWANACCRRLSRTPTAKRYSQDPKITIPPRRSKTQSHLQGRNSHLFTCEWRACRRPSPPP